MLKSPNKLRLLIGLFALGCAISANAQRAIWTWEAESASLLHEPAAVDKVITFLQSKKVRTIYLYADSYQGHQVILKEPQRYETLLRHLHAAGFDVYALVGSAFLNTERYVLPEFRAEALAMLKRILDYNANKDSAARFDGVNIDIEPHVLSQWDTQRSYLLEQFIDLAADLMALKRQSGQSIKIGPAIPFWFDGIASKWGGRTRPTSEHLQDIYDYITLMDYRDHAQGPDGIVAHAKDEIIYANKIGKKVQIGIEISPNELKKVTFDHLREADLEREIQQTTMAFVDDPGFGGVVLHHLSSYRKWLAKNQ